MQDDATDPGVARAGAALAERRRKLGIKQRELARRKIITASSLIDFEKGRSWPRERTRTMLEELVDWPAGTLARIRSGGPVPGSEPAPRPDSESALESDDSEASLIVSAVAVAMNTFNTAIANLPAEDDPRFPGHIQAVLADLRQLESITARAVRSSRGSPAVIRALALVRRRYDELTARAAKAPGATLGQRLHTARRRANLTAAEAADALGMPVELVTTVEGGQAADDESAARIEAMIAGLQDG
ncbi:helix-turn-helix domain-containing protein [Mycobacterium sp.]|uniref:helix-turn-helix domain-containing protein n=1 Tax=Mycobacterium sp. TaxID=1785 RepID=UPI002D474AEA|nr:helix-turn-helix domain-containing protein [Mycobacterium sp.]HZA08991.1 helix-turn-helix domain-containing protein [Mycobacterium sp.]